MSLLRVRWRAVFGGVVAAEVALIAAAFGWVAIYSLAIHTGEQPDFYQRYAQEVSSWVSVIAGIPIFYACGFWLARNTRSAAALFLIWAAFDLSILIFVAGSNSSLRFREVALSYVLKLAASLAGGVWSDRRRAAVSPK